MSARLWIGLPVLLLLGALVVRCGDTDPEPVDRHSAALEAAVLVPGPAPGDDGDGVGRPGLGGWGPSGPMVRVAGDAAGRLMIWDAWSWIRGARLGSDGSRLDPSTGLLLDPDRTPVPARDACDLGRVGDAWLVPCRSTLAVLADGEAPEVIAPPWSPGFYVRVAGGPEMALVTGPAPEGPGAGTGYWGLSAAGEVRWEALDPTLGLEVWPARSESGFLAVWTDTEPDVWARPVGDDGALGTPVAVIAGVRVRGLASGPAGVLVWAGDPAWQTDGSQWLVTLDPATGAPLESVLAPIREALRLVPASDGWLVLTPTGVLHVAPDLTLEQTPIPVDPEWTTYDVVAGDGAVFLAAVVPPGTIQAGPMVAEAWAPTTVSTGLQWQDPRALGRGDGWLVVQRTSDLVPDTDDLQAWRLDAAGVPTDTEPLLLGPAPTEDTYLGPPEVAVAGDGPPWLVAVGEEGALRLWVVEGAGPPTDLGRLDCDLGTPSVPGEVHKGLVSPAVVALDEGWLVGCLDRAVAPDTGEPPTRVRLAFLRLEADLSPRWPEVRPVGGWSAGVDSTALAGVAWDGQAVFASGWASDPASLAVRLVAVDPEDGALVEERHLATRAIGPVGLGADDDRLGVVWQVVAQFRLTGRLLTTLDDAAPVVFEPAGVGGTRSFSTWRGPLMVEGEPWVCWSLVQLPTPVDLQPTVVCEHYDASDGTSLAWEEVWEPGVLGAATAGPEGLALAVGVPEDGTLRGGLVSLAAEGPGDGGDGGDAEVPDGDGGDAGDAEVPDGDGGDAGDAEVPDGDGGDAGDAEVPDGDGGDAGDAEVPDADAGDAGDAEVPDADAGDGGSGVSDAGTAPGTPSGDGCEGCSTSSGSALAGLLLLLGFRARETRSPRRRPGATAEGGELPRFEAESDPAAGG